MNSDNNFTFISPIPYPIKYLEPSDNNVTLGSFSASECVEFFWRVKRVTINAQLSIYLKGTYDEEPIWDENLSTSLDSTNSECAFAVPMRKRYLYTSPCYIINDHSNLQIAGPYYANEYDAYTDFAQRNFYYNLGFYFGVGCITISSTYIPKETENLSMVTAQRYPFEIFGKTYYLNLNVPIALLNPEEYGIETSFSGNAELNFEFF